MTAEERIAQLELAKERAKTARLEAELAVERAENASLRQQTEEVLARLHEAEGQLAKDSHNSHQLTSSGGPGRAPRSQRRCILHGHSYVLCRSKITSSAVLTLLYRVQACKASL